MVCEPVSLGALVVPLAPPAMGAVPEVPPSLDWPALSAVVADPVEPADAESDTLDEVSGAELVSTGSVVG